ncbi:hypothetical protein BC835DRAFT_432649 [Cytidiella melzeri]|nr:hypothetical protein BC835DRAFT_432649 [Cytidiella melzeri]
MADSEFDMISHFGAVDELIQLIYQGTNKFVLISAVDGAHWTLHLGLTGAEGRWWKGNWTEKDIFRFLGNTSASNKLVETFSERLADNIVKGELFIGNWSTESGAEITLTLNPSAKSPVHIPLGQLDPIEAAAYASKILAEIANQAQKSRSCHLYPSGNLATPYHEPLNPRRAWRTPVALTPALTTSTASSSKREASLGHTEKTAKSSRHAATLAEVEADEQIKELKAELARAHQEVKDAKRKVETAQPDNLLASRAKTAVPAARPVKGASLANPNKKARRYQAMEFED